MAGKAAKIIVSERQQVLLNEFSKSRTLAKGVVQRATIILLGFAGLLNEAIAARVGLNRLQVGIWRQRRRDAWDTLCVWECTEPHRLREALLNVLADAPRPGTPATFTAAQVAQIVALACEPPKLSGRPIDHWTLRELRDEAIKRQIVAAISVAQAGRFLQQAAVQPHRKKMWLNTTEKDPQKFQAEVEKVCRTYLDASAQAADGTHTLGGCEFIEPPCLPIPRRGVNLQNPSSVSGPWLRAFCRKPANSALRVLLALCAGNLCRFRRQDFGGTQTLRT